MSFAFPNAASPRTPFAVAATGTSSGVTATKSAPAAGLRLRVTRIYVRGDTAASTVTLTMGSHTKTWPLGVGTLDVSFGPEDGTAVAAATAASVALNQSTSACKASIEGVVEEATPAVLTS